MLRVRWSWRDLRRRWVQVAVIAVILAIGTGVYAALGSTAHWRKVSNDVSFALTNLHDVKLRLSEGTSTPAGTLTRLSASIEDAAAIERAEERLVWPTQVEVAAPKGTVLVQGVLVGAAPGATIDRTWLRDGAEPSDPSAGIVELNFARARDLPATGTMTVGGGLAVTYTGTAMQPEYFYLVPAGGELLGQGNQATMFLGLDRAQELAGLSGQVNDLVVNLTPSADAAAVRRQLEVALAGASLSGTVTAGEDEPTYRILYRDIGNDQQLWNVVSILILLGASFAAFNLISRIVESQRRELGIGMALGVPARQLAVRPLLVGFQIALLGALGGIVVGLLVAAAMQSLLDAVLPLPAWRTTFQLGPFVVATVIGIGIPFVATAIPVWRAVRVEPVQAIRTGHGASVRPGWARLGARLPWPRRSLQQYPIRSLLRTPRRTLLTVLAIAAAMTVLVAVFGMLDSLGRTMHEGDRELTRTAADRVAVRLSTFEPVGGPVLSAVAADPSVGSVAAGLVVPAQLRTEGHDPVDVSLEVFDFSEAPWAPAVRRGQLPDPSAGILVAEKAAADLGVSPGDTVTLEHPVREGAGYRMVSTELKVAGTHRLPMRPYAYLDASQASLLGLEGFVNEAQVVPAPAATSDEVQRALFTIPGVASAVPVGAAGKAWDDVMAQYTGILRIMQLAVLSLALLIAFNTSSISIDERSREHATMFAFGVARRRVLAMSVAESSIVGLLGTAVGALGGLLVVRWVFGTLIPDTMPDIGIDPYLAPWTLAVIVVLGVLAVALAPLLNARRLRQMDIPSTLRLVE